MGVQRLQIETKYREQREILLNSFWCVCVCVCACNFIARYCRFMISGSINVENAPTPARYYRSNLPRGYLYRGEEMDRFGINSI